MESKDGQSIAIATLGHPDKIKVLCQRVCLRREICPLCIRVAVPIESLEHYAAVSRRPALNGLSFSTERSAKDCNYGKKSFHLSYILGSTVQI